MPQNHPISVECDKTFEIDPLKLSEMNRRVINTLLFIHQYYPKSLSLSEIH